MVTLKNIAKNSCWMLLAIPLVFVGCKRSLDYGELEQGDGTITIMANKAGVTSSSSQGSSSANKTEFTIGDQIGLFTQLKTEADATTTTTLKANALYSFDTPTWEPASADDKLQYSSTGPLYLSAYYPYIETTTGPTTINGTVLNHSIYKEQSDLDKLNDLDILWAGANNSTNGYSSQREAIDLLFSHIMTKVSFYVRIVDSNPSSSPAIDKIYLNSIEVLGQQIFTETNFNLLNGKHQNNTKDVNDTIAWKSQELYGKEFSIVTTSEDPTYVTDMLLVPFVAQSELNKIRYILNFVNTASNSVTSQNFATSIPVYNPAAISGPTTLNFEQNRHNKVIITIDISTGWMAIDASILDWDTSGPVTDLDADRD